MPVTLTHEPLAYRRDIDGLRAIAVLAVVVHHAWPRQLNGGFIGVDIFFVISGFLISTTLFDDAERGTLSCRDFYVRRARRLLPALLIVLAFSLGIAGWLCFPKDARLIGKHVLGGAAFVANLVAWGESGYFDASSEFKPLLHLWSLGVEEQYYLAWPLVVVALLRRRPVFVAAMVGLLIGSFAWNVASVQRDPAMAFYSPTTRMWELLVGSLLAYLVRFDRGAAGRLFARLAPSVNAAAWLPAALSGCGMALLVLSLAVSRETDAFPGGWALLPTLGAACMLAAGPAAWWNRRVLSAAPLVFVGRISYPLYLWHWPLLTFPKLIDGTTSPTVRAAAVALSMVLAWLTCRFVEQPVRFGPRRRETPWALGGALLLLGAGGGWLYAVDGLPGRFPPELREFATSEFTFYAAQWRADRCFLNPAQDATDFGAECLPTTHDAGTGVWLWGDSHAAALYPGLRDVMTGAHQRLVQTTASACPPVLDLQLPRRPKCWSINQVVMERISRRPPGVVVLAGNWFSGGGSGRPVDLAQLAQTVARLKSAGVVKVVIIGPFPRWSAASPSLVMRAWRRTGALPGVSFDQVDTRVFAVDRAVRQVAAESGALFVSSIDAFCTEKGCLPTVTVQGRVYPAASDDSHLTPAASTMLAEKLLAPVLLPR